MDDDGGQRARPKKRTKILRACDVCRRKKVRCDAVYLVAESRVTQICENCRKHGEECTFSRIPMKRGPTKGFVREKLEREMLVPTQSLTPTSTLPHISPPAAPLIPQGPQLLKNVPIKLPPLFPSIKSEATPLAMDRNTSPPILGPFWKVPYEMPTPQAPVLRRKLLVESLLSTLTLGVPRIPVPLDSALYLDSDDDFYSVRLRGPLLGLNLPRNSVLLLLLLNGRIKKVTLSSHLPQIATTPTVGTSVPPEPLEQNIRTYYHQIHGDFPILTNDNGAIPRFLESISVDDERSVKIAQLFAQALANLIHYRQAHVSDHVAILSRLADMPCLGLPQPVLILFMATFLLTNYAIFLAGENYSIGIGMSVLVFHDLRVLEGFAALMASGKQPVADTPEVMLPKLAYLTSVLDTAWALGLGKQRTAELLSLMGFMDAHLQWLVPLQWMVKLRPLWALLAQAADARTRLLIEPSNPIKFPPLESADDLFLTLVANKFEMYHYIYEMCLWLDQPTPSNDEELRETLSDYAAKLLRLLKKLVLLLVALVASLATVYKYTIAPWIQLAVGQLFRMIKFVKTVVDGLAFALPALGPDLVQRMMKVHTDLSQAYIQLTLNYLGLLLGPAAIEKLKATVNGYDLQFVVPVRPPSPKPMTGAQVMASWRGHWKPQVMQCIIDETTNGWC